VANPHRDLPAGSQPWAKEVDASLKRVAELEAIVRRLTENAGIDMSNPKRGINTGDTPNATNPVAQKISSLADVDSYNVLDGQVLTWDQQKQKWLPKTRAGGNRVLLPADTWSVPRVGKNIMVNPAFESTTEGWTFDQDQNNSYVRVNYSIVEGAGRNGGNAMQIDFYYDNNTFDSSWVEGCFLGLQPYAVDFGIWVKTLTATPLRVATILKGLGTSYNSFAQDVKTPPVSEWTEFRVQGYGGEVGTDLLLWVDPVPANAPAVSILVDDVYVGDSSWFSPFSGDTPDDANYAYTWEGAPRASKSVATERRKLKAPSVVMAGALAQISGEGWVPGETAIISLFNEEIAQIVVGADGTFNKAVELPAEISDFYSLYFTASPSNNYYSVYVDTELVATL